MGAGRPPIYETLEDMLPALEAWEKSLIDGDPPTVTGLALALGFADKSSVYYYKEKEEFSYPIKRALLVVENGYEKELRKGSPTGSIFALKNMGWKDKSETELSGGVNINPKKFIE